MLDSYWLVIRTVHFLTVTRCAEKGLYKPDLTSPTGQPATF